MSFNRSKFAITDGKPFSYVIDLDERGSFIAHVENENGRSVFEFVAGKELKAGQTCLFKDGWMKDTGDIFGLENYLKTVQIISENDWLERGN